MMDYEKAGKRDKNHQKSMEILHLALITQKIYQ